MASQLVRSSGCTAAPRRACCRCPSSRSSVRLVRAAAATPATSGDASVINSRRDMLVLMGAIQLALGGVAQADESSVSGIELINDQPGFGTRSAQKGDLLLLHYVGTLKETGQVFDSTRGGLMYRDGGPGVLRPIIIRLGGDPVPGVCAGLRAGLAGMRIGGKRTFVVPPELGFKGTVLAPYAIVPAGSTLQYEVELIRLSAKGPDALTKGIDRCGQGGAAQQTVNCSVIEPAEYV